VLTYFAKRIKLDSQPGHQQKSLADYLVNCIKLIQTLEILSPIQLVNALTDDTGISLELIKPFLLKTFEAANTKLKREEDAYLEAREDARKIEEEILKMGEGVVFQNETCSRCGFALSAPSVHFFCKHSYHKR
jgi:vacuolar protein sorting-associated protein 11